MFHIIALFNQIDLRGFMTKLSFNIRIRLNMNISVGYSNLCKSDGVELNVQWINDHVIGVDPRSADRPDLERERYTFFIRRK